MNTFIKIFAIGAISSLLLQSCGSFLDTDPYTGVGESQAITNEGNATAALIGVYDGFQHYYYYGRDFVVQGEAPTENVKLNPTNSNRFVQEITWSVTKSLAGVADFWNKGNETINRANKIIHAEISGDEKTINKIKGEAYALRALVHFDLVRMYAQCYDFTENHNHIGIPYITKYEAEGQPSRNTVAEVYKNIIADLKKAQELGVAGTNRAMAPFTLSTDALNAILAKVYLYMGDYNNAKSYAELVIPKYTLVPNAEYMTSWTKESLSESIFTIAQIMTDYGKTNALGYIFVEEGYGDLLVNESLYGLYADNDIRKEWFIKGKKTANVDKIYIKGKYPGRNGTVGLDNFNVLRVSEMYLIAAEASAKATPKDEVKAQQYLNAIRQRAIPTALAVTVTGDDLINEILLEKRKELAFEGNYYHDLKRLKLDVKAANTGKAEPLIIKYPNNKFAWPIPERETNANPNIEQNPGY